MSTQTEPHELASHAEAAVSIRTVELVVGVLLTGLGLLVIWSNYQLGAGWADDGPKAGYFPLRLGVIILIASIAVIVQATLKNDLSVFIERGQLKLVATVLVPLIVYIGTIGFIGIYVASALFIGIFMMAVGKFHFLKAILSSSCTDAG